MSEDYYALILGDIALAAILLALFWYVSRVSLGLRGIALWGASYLTYTAGSALLEGATLAEADGAATQVVFWAAGYGSLLACAGVAGLAWAVMRFVEQRGGRPLDYALMIACMGFALVAWMGFGDVRAHRAAISAAEVVALVLMVGYLERMNHAPYKLPARLMMAAAVVLACLYARDLTQALAGRYAPASDWINLDLTLWFMLNFCMLTLSSFRAAESLRHNALFDPLTDALNRRGLDDQLNGAGRRSRSRGTAVIALDLDHFKRINDQHGHPIGDQVLRRFSDAVRHSIRSDDLFARVGGEEFVVVARDASPTDAVALAERIRREIGQQHILDIAPQKVTVSAGVAAAAGAAEIDALMQCADEALYEAKRLGRDRVQLWRPMPEPVAQA